MKILVTVSSKHGAADEVGRFVAERLTGAGHRVLRARPREVRNLSGIDAVVCGSAVYIAKWMPEASEFLERFHDQLVNLPLWAFSLGLSGVPHGVPQDPPRIGPTMLSVKVIDYQTFAGRFAPEVLTLRERTVAKLAGAVEGDFRNWTKIGAWADSIVSRLETLTKEQTSL